MEKLRKTCYNFKPDLVVLGHADLISNDTLGELKDEYPFLKVAQWFLDPLNINGPDFSEINSAKKSLNSPLFYEYDTVLKNTGIHEIKITVESQIGKTEILKKINVKESTNILNSLIIFMMFLCIFIPILIFIRKYTKLRKIKIEN